jgi:hypothetical protein
MMSEGRTSFIGAPPPLEVMSEPPTSLLIQPTPEQQADLDALYSRPNLKPILLQMVCLMVWLQGVEARGHMAQGFAGHGAMIPHVVDGEKLVPQRGEF